MSVKNSAGVLVFRRVGDTVLVLLVQSRGGESEAWSIPKGEFVIGVEEPRSAAAREIAEELGIEVDPLRLGPLGECVYANKKKRVYCFSWETTTELELILDNREIGRARFVTLDEARELLHKAQRVFVDRLVREISN